MPYYPTLADVALTPSPPPGAERAGVRWGIPEHSPIPTSPSQRFALGPSLSALKGGEGIWAGAVSNVVTTRPASVQRDGGLRPQREAGDKPRACGPGHR